MSKDFSMVAVRLEGKTPLLMHNVQLADPLNEYTQAIKEITAKKTRKTESEEEKLRKLEFLGGLYYHPDSGVYIPGEWIEGTIRDMAKDERKGKDVTSGLMVDEARCPLIYSGPKKPEELYKLKEFVDYRSVRPQKKTTIMRVRPRFNAWSVEATLIVISEVLSVSKVQAWLEKAGMLKGLGDYRPKFGRFKVTKFEEA